MDAAARMLRHRYPAHAWQPVTLGMSGAGVHRLTGPSDLHVKIGDGVVAAEGERLAWLASVGVPAPRVVDAGQAEGFAYVVTETLPGRPASDPWPAQRRTAVIEALGAFTRDLHALPAADCPFDRRLSVRVPRARADATVSRADLDALDRLLAAGPVEDPVVCHGDLCLPNVLLDPASLSVTGVIDVGRLGVADRYADAAVMTRSIASDLNPQFAPAHAEAFWRAYGVFPPDPLRVDLYRLLDELP